jgi:hypothetical protein
VAPALYAYAMFTDRPNTKRAAAVDQVLAEQEDPRAAARLLLEHGADITLICRVLAEPGRCRGWAGPPAPVADE